MSQVEFNPYREWLRLEGNPNDFYVLLGLSSLEADHDVIQSAVRRATLRVRKIKPGPRMADWTSLLDQIEHAGQVLSDPTQKQAYDQQIRGHVNVRLSHVARSADAQRGSIAQRTGIPDPMAPLEDEAPIPAASGFAVAVPHSNVPPSNVPPSNVPPSNVPPSNVPPSNVGPVASPPPAAQPVTKPVRVPRRRGSNVRRKQRISYWMAAVLGSLVFALLALTLWFMVEHNQVFVAAVSQPARAAVPVGDAVPAPRPPFGETAQDLSPTAVASRPLAKPPVEMPEPTVEPAQPLSHGPGEPETDTRGPAAQEMSDPPPAKPTPAQLDQLRLTLRQAFESLASKDFEGSKSRIQAAKSMAKTPEHQAMVERLDTLQEYVNEFWNAVEDGLKQIENTELVVNGTRVFVVSVDDRELVLRVLGRRRRVDRKNLPNGLTLAIADRWFKPNAASTKVFKGAYMSVTPQYSESDVRQVWQEAKQSGADLGDLPMVLDDRQWCLP